MRKRIYEKGQRVRIDISNDEFLYGVVEDYQLHGFVEGKTGANKKKKETDVPHHSDYWKYLVAIPDPRRNKVWFLDYEMEDAPIPNSIRFIKDEDIEGK